MEITEILTAGFEAGPLKLVVWEVLYVIVLVLVLAVILDRALFRPVLAILQERERRIEQARGGQEDTLRAIDEKRRAHAARIAAARRGALERLEAARTEGEGVRKTSLDDARRQAEERVSSARRAVEQAASRARADLEKRAGELARSIAGRILGREVA